MLTECAIGASRLSPALAVRECSCGEYSVAIAGVETDRRRADLLVGSMTATRIDRAESKKCVVVALIDEIELRLESIKELM